MNAAGMVQSGATPENARFVELASAAFDRQMEITLKTGFHDPGGAASLPSVARIGTPVAFTVARDSSLLEITVIPTELEI